MTTTTISIPEGERAAFFAFRAAMLTAFAAYRETVTLSEAEGEADALYAEMRGVAERRVTPRPVTLSPKVWSDLRRELDALHEFAQRVAEQSCQAELVDAAVALGADRG